MAHCSSIPGCIVSSNVGKTISRSIMGRDPWDFGPIRKEVDEDECRESMHADFGADLAFLDWFKPTLFLRGNHDEVLWDLRTAVAATLKATLPPTTRAKPSAASPKFSVIAHRDSP